MIHLAMNPSSRSLELALLLFFLVAGATTGLPARDVWQEVNEHNASISDQERQWKFEDMSASPFAFYRATAHLYYQDIADKLLQGPSDWEGRADLHTWISGDFHLQNVGFEPIGGNNRRFELNDFDEACRAPFHWDLTRFVASLYLVQDSAAQPPASKKVKGRPLFAITKDEADLLSATFLRAYRQALAANTIASLSGSELDHPTDHGKQASLQPFVRHSLTLSDKKLKEKETKFWDKETKPAREEFLMAQGSDRYVEADAKCVADITQSWKNYLGSLDPAFVASKGEDYFKPVKFARRLRSGLGSLGVLKIYILLEGPTTGAADNFIVEAKECTVPAPVKSGALPRPAHPVPEAARVSQATRAMTLPADPTEGYFQAGAYSFHVTCIHPLGGGTDLEEFESLLDLQDYAQWSGVALANAHCRADASFALTARLAMEKSDDLIEDLCKRGRAYADQVTTDHKAFAEAYANSKQPKDK